MTSAEMLALPDLDAVGRLAAADLADEEGACWEMVAWLRLPLGTAVSVGPWCVSAFQDALFCALHAGRNAAHLTWRWEPETGWFLRLHNGAPDQMVELVPFHVHAAIEAAVAQALEKAM